MTISYRNSKLIPIYAELDWNTAGFDTAALLGSLPLGAKLLLANVVVQTQFNAGSTNRLNIGFASNGSGSEICTNVDIGVAANTRIELPQAWIQNPLSAARSFYARYTQTGSAASAGKLHVNLLAFI